jgi:membrane protein implicated in regulation of membrane protease activity
MDENFWLIIIGAILIAFEILFGALTGFDLAFIGVSLVVGGFFVYLGSSWQLGIVVSLIITLIYLVFMRLLVRKRLLIAVQKLGIDCLIGKTAKVISPIKKAKIGKILLDGEVWLAKANSNFSENELVMVSDIGQNLLKISKLLLP